MVPVLMYKIYHGYFAGLQGTADNEIQILWGLTVSEAPHRLVNLCLIHQDSASGDHSKHPLARRFDVLQVQRNVSTMNNLTLEMGRE